MTNRSESAVPRPGNEYGPGFRRFRVGPGLIGAILLSAVAWFFTRPDLQNRQGPPVVERAALPTGRPARTPDLAELLRHGDELGLTAPQRAAIARLVKQWETESVERRRDMDQAAAAFNEFMRGAQQRGKGGLGEIQRQAAEGSALTSEWLARRAYFYRLGLAELMPEQREKAVGLIEKPLGKPQHSPKRARSEARS